MMFVTVLVLTALAASTQAATLNLEVYFESLCPDSRRFITNQLSPAYELIKENLNVVFLPWGKASIELLEDGTYNFTCQHGPNECYGNEIQECAIELSPENSDNFIFCAMASDDASDDTLLAECAQSSGIVWDDVKECVTSGRGHELFIEYGNITAALAPPLSYVPTLVFDGRYSTTLQDLGEHYFLQTACFLLNNEPSACGSP